jgi:hypothetical protein
MTQVFVQFTDASETTIQSVFSSSQDPAVYANQAAIDSNDARYLAFINPQPTLALLVDAAKTKVRTMRVTAFSSLAGIQSEALANGDTKTAKAICTLQDQLRAITDIDLSACKTQADIDAAFTAAWLAIVAAAPANVASAFNVVQP